MHPPNHLTRYPRQELSCSQGRQKEQERSREDGLFCPGHSARKRSCRDKTPNLFCLSAATIWCLPSHRRATHVGSWLQRTLRATSKFGMGTLKPLGYPGCAIFRLISCSTLAPLPRAPQADFPSNQIHVSPVPALALCEVSTGCSSTTKGCMPHPDENSHVFPDGPNLRLSHLTLSGARL